MTLPTLVERLEREGSWFNDLPKAANLIRLLEAKNEQLREALVAVDSEIVLEGQLKEMVDAALHASEQQTK